MIPVKNVDLAVYRMESVLLGKWNPEITDHQLGTGTLRQGKNLEIIPLGTVPLERDLILAETCPNKLTLKIYYFF